MKFMANIVLFLFFAFLATPTVIGIIERDVDTSVAYTFSEEEIQKEVKEIPVSIGHILQIQPIASSLSSSVINIENELKHDNASEEIFSPPPETV